MQEIQKKYTNPNLQETEVFLLYKGFVRKEKMRIMQETQASLRTQVEVTSAHRDAPSRFGDWTPGTAYAYCRSRAAAAVEQWREKTERS